LTKRKEGNTITGGIMLTTRHPIGKSNTKTGGTESVRKSKMGRREGAS